MHEVYKTQYILQKEKVNVGCVQKNMNRKILSPVLFQPQNNESGRSETGDGLFWMGTKV